MFRKRDMVFKLRPVLYLIILFYYFCNYANVF